MGAIGAIWGIFGFALLLVWVLIRLTPLAVEATEYEWTMLQWSHHWVIMSTYQEDLQDLTWMSIQEVIYRFT